MLVQWRSLLDSIRVPWRDRGKNTSRKNVNICCPFCRDDTGFHLGIAEQREAYYCFRRPEHAGHSFVALLVKLGQARVEAVKLLNEYTSRDQEARVEAEPVPLSKTQMAWDRFETAERAPGILDYLYSRGFDNPETLVSRYDVRFAPYGKWSYRVLLPFHQDGALCSWTGRAIVDSLTPKYLNFESHRDGLVYQPRAARDTCVVVEGPLDALKIAVAGEGLPVSAVALTGKQMNAARAWNVRQATIRARRAIVCLDADTGLGERSRLSGELRGALPCPVVKRATLPPGYKDPGAMPQRVATAWLEQVCATVD